MEYVTYGLYNNTTLGAINVNTPLNGTCCGLNLPSISAIRIHYFEISNVDVAFYDGLKSIVFQPQYTNGISTSFSIQTQCFHGLTGTIGTTGATGTWGMCTVNDGPTVPRQPFVVVKTLPVTLSSSANGNRITSINVYGITNQNVQTALTISPGSFLNWKIRYYTSPKTSSGCQTALCD